ncbi:phospholipid:diacylglycerol acyltransferase 1-like protein [Tanacetum coccineum]
MMVEINGGEKAVIIPHSMGVLYFLHFMKWVEAPAPMGGGGGSDWCAKHIKAVMNIGGEAVVLATTHAPKALAGIFSTEAKDIAFARVNSIKSTMQLQQSTSSSFIIVLKLDVRRCSFISLAMYLVYYDVIVVLAVA